MSNATLSTWLNPSYHPTVVPYPEVEPLPEQFPGKRDAGSPAWWIAHLNEWGMGIRGSVVPEGATLTNAYTTGERWRTIHCNGAGASIEFDFDTTGKNPDWGTAMCTWSEIEAKSGGRRL